MYAFTMQRGAKRMVGEHMIGVMTSGFDNEGRGRARMGVGHGGVLDRFTIHERETVRLSDGWSLRLVAAAQLESSEGKAILGMALMTPDETLERTRANAHVM